MSGNVVRSARSAGVESQWRHNDLRFAKTKSIVVTSLRAGTADRVYDDD